jgi:hypothetical protein
LYSYNSAIFATEPANKYNIFTLHSDFVQGPSPPNVTSLNDVSGTIQGYIRNGADQVDNIQLFSRLQNMAVAGTLDRLENKECADAYLLPFQATKRNLLMIVDEDVATEVDVCDIYFAGGSENACGSYETSRWVCAQQNQITKPSCWTPCDGPSMVSQTNEVINAGNWKPFGRPVQYCLSETSTESCELHLSLQIIIVVMIMNIIKVVVMLTLAFGAFRLLQPLLTIGDAISSFIENPDSTTENMCLISKAEIVAQPGLWSASPRKFESRALSFRSSISLRRWLTCVIL